MAKFFKIVICKNAHLPLRMTHKFIISSVVLDKWSHDQTAKVIPILKVTSKIINKIGDNFLHKANFYFFLKWRN